MYRPHRHEDFDAFNDRYGLEGEDNEDDQTSSTVDVSSVSSRWEGPATRLETTTVKGNPPPPLPLERLSPRRSLPHLGAFKKGSHSPASASTEPGEMKSGTSSASTSSPLKRTAQQAGIDAASSEDIHLVAKGSGKRPKAGASQSAIETSKPSLVVSQSRSKSESRLAKPKKLTPAQLTKQKLAETSKFTQEQYIEYVDASGPVRGGKPSNALKGMVILYLALANTKGFATEETRGKIDFMVKNGGKVVPDLGDQVTHVVSELDEKLTTQRLGFKAVNDVPKSLPILHYKWITKVVNTGIKSDLIASDKFYTRFISRTVVRQRSETMNASRRSSISIRTNPGSDSDDSHHRPDSDEEDATSDKGEGPSDSKKLEQRVGNFSTLPPPMANKDLDHWVTLAKEYRDLDDMLENDSDEDVDTRGDNSVEDDRLENPPDVAPRDIKYACDDKNGSKVNLNADITEQLARLVKIYDATGDRWKAMQTTRAIASIRRHPTRLKSGKEALKLRFVGQRMAEKIDDVIKTGNMRRLQYEESTESAIVTKLFMGIYGVGMTTARDWYSRGMRTLDDLSGSHRRIVLTPAQQIGLKYYTDLAERMPRSEAKAIFDAIKAIAIGIDPSLELTIMGSYRRGQETCGDIDILLTRPTIDGRSHSGILRKLLPKLRAAGVLTEDLSYPSDLDDEEAKYMGLCRLGHEGKMRRIDILTIPYHQRGAALIYFTGDDVFNRSLRLKARHDGYSLNQRGLFTGVTRDPKTKVKLSNGIIIASETEREIFNILKVPWQEPHQRRRAT